MPELTDPDRRVLVAADMESYSRRDNVLQYRAQSAFRRIMEEATAELGLRRVAWQIQQGGDGELAVLPAGTSERAVVTRFVPILDRLVREHNRGLTSDAKVRLRIAVHQGLVHLDGANGFPSEAIVHVCRLVDAPEAKAALRRFPTAGVVLIVSDAMYQDVVRHYHDLQPEHFARVRAALPDKGFSATAWIYVPGGNASAPATGPDPMGGPESGGATQPMARPEGGGTSMGGGQTFGNITTHGPAAFGNHNTLNTPGWGTSAGGPQT